MPPETNCCGNTPCTENRESYGECAAEKIAELQDWVRTTLPDGRPRAELLTTLDHAYNWAKVRC